MAQVFKKFLEEFSLFHRIIARSICMLSVRRAFLQSIYIGKEWNSMVFLNFLPEVIPGHYNFGMNRQEILREIYLWYSKRAVFSRFGDIWLLSKKPPRRRVCNTQLALKKSSSRAFFCRFETLNFCYAIFSSVNLNGTCCTRRRYAYPGTTYVLLEKDVTKLPLPLA